MAVWGRKEKTKAAQPTKFHGFQPNFPVFKGLAGLRRNARAAKLRGLDATTKGRTP